MIPLFYLYQIKVLLFLLTAPDFENPSDADSNNIYKITANVSDGSLNTSANFEITVTNDTSDDPTSTEYDGTYIGAGPIQGATICIEVTEHTSQELSTQQQLHKMELFR